MDMKVNDHLLRISAGYISTNKEFNLGDDVKITLSGSVTKVEHHDNQDGTFNRIAVIKMVTTD